MLRGPQRACAGYRSLLDRIDDVVDGDFVVRIYSRILELCVFLGEIFRLFFSLLLPPVPM
jgi:hypothetical protein